MREYLNRYLNVPASHPCQDNDELGREDLLSELSPVRWIITKSALMEGWDCPFAYLLVMLDNTRAQRAITQLVGRVMRQPHARRTGRELLDQCYVYCWDTDVGVAVGHVKAGLEQEGGLGDEVLKAGDLASPCSGASDFGVRTSFCRWYSTRMATLGLSWTTRSYPAAH